VQEDYPSLRKWVDTFELGSRQYSPC
jgi:hypothetical protein